MKKTLTLGLALALTSSVAMAEDNIGVSIGAERNLDTELNSIYVNPTITSGSLELSLKATMTDTVVDQAKFNLSGADLDLSWSATDSVTLYVENDYDADFKHTATIVGGKISF
jgi:hypothetical protein